MADQKIASFLKQLRKTSGLSVNEVTELLKDFKINISTKTLYGYESGLSMPNADIFVALCRIYKCDNPMDIFGNPSIAPTDNWLIEKYHALDEHGKKHIDYELDRETQRVQALTQKDAAIADLRQQLESQLPLSSSVGEATHPYYIAYYQRVASAGNGEYLFDDIPSDLIGVKDTPMARQADFVLGVIGDSMEPTYHDGDRVFVEKTDMVEIGEIGIFFVGSQCYIKEAGIDGLVSHNKKYDTIPGTENIRCVGRVLGKADEYQAQRRID